MFFPEQEQGSSTMDAPGPSQINLASEHDVDVNTTYGNVPEFNFSIDLADIDFDRCVVNEDMEDPPSEEEQDYRSEEEEDEDTPAPVPAPTASGFHTASANIFESTDWIDDNVMSELSSAGSTSAPTTIALGQSYSSKDELKHAITSTNVLDHRKYKIVSSKPNRYTVRCSAYEEQNCPWYLHAAIPICRSKFVITKFIGNHTCLNQNLADQHEQITAKFVTAKIIEIIHVAIDMSPAAIIFHIKALYNYNIFYKKAWHAKQIAIKGIFRSFKGSYGLLPPFLGAIQVANPGTVVNFDYEPNRGGGNTFKKVFWSFGPYI